MNKMYIESVADLETGSYDPRNRNNDHVFYVRDREAGNIIDRFGSLCDAEAAIAEYEAEDRRNGDYSEDFYEVVEADILLVLRRYGLTQSAFSRLLGIPLRTVQGWCNGTRAPSPWVLNLIDYRLSN